MASEEASPVRPTKIVTQLAGSVAIGLLLAVIILAVTGRLLPAWQRILGASPPPLSASQHLFVADGARLTAYRLDSGAEIWHSTYTDTQLTAGAGIVIISGTDHKLTALDGTTGTVRWMTNRWPAAMINTLRIEMVNNLVLVTQHDPLSDSSPTELFALDPATGKERWHFTASGPFDLRLMSAPGLVLVGERAPGQPNGLRHMYALDTATGTVKWSYQAPGIEWAVPLAVEGGYAILEADGFVAVNLNDGAIRWRISSNAAISGNAFGNGAFYIHLFTATQNVVKTYNVADGTLLWSLDGTQFGRSIAAGAGMVVFGDLPNSSQLHTIGLRASDGSRIWQAQDGIAGETIMIGNGSVILFGSDGKSNDTTTLVGLNVSDGSYRWSIPLNDSPRFFSDKSLPSGELLLTTNTSAIICAVATGAIRWQVAFTPAVSGAGVVTAVG